MTTSAPCPRCGTAVAPGTKFCPNCGYAFDSAPQPGYPAQTPPEAAAPTYTYGAAPVSPQGYQPPAGYQPPPGPPGYGPPAGYQSPGGTQGYPPPSGYQSPPGLPGYQPPPPGAPNYQVPPSYAGPLPATPRSGRPRWLVPVLAIVGVVILACAAIGVFAFVLANNLTQPVTTAGDSFMTALRDSNYSQAYSQCTTALQNEVGDAQQFQDSITNVRPTTWNWSSRRLENGTGYLDGTATLASGGAEDVSLVLDQDAGTWKVSGYHFKQR
jgi:hypothetical protein